MKRHGSRNGRCSRNLTRSARGEVRLALGMSVVLSEEHRLDEEQIGAAQEACKSLPIARVVGHIRYIADFLSGYELQDFGLQLAEWEDLSVRAISRAPVNSDRGIVRRASTHLFLEVGEPLSRRQSELIEPSFPDIDVRVFFEGECERGDCMVLEGYRSHPERRTIQQYPVRGVIVGQGLPFETRSAAKLSALQVSAGIEFVGGDYEVRRIVLHEIPGVGCELVFELPDEPPGTV